MANEVISDISAKGGLNRAERSIRRENNSRQPVTLPPCGLARMNKIPMTN